MRRPSLSGNVGQVYAGDRNDHEKGGVGLRPNQVYRDVYPSKMSRGGTKCSCGAEKDRRATHCKKHYISANKGSGDDRNRGFMVEYYRGGITMRAMAKREGITSQRMSRLINKATVRENVTPR